MPPVRSRKQIEADVRADFKQLDRKQRFGGAQSDFVHWNRQFQERPWTRAAILAARSNPVFLKYSSRERLGSDWLSDIFGRGKARPPWVAMARVFASELLRHANPPQKGLGSETGPLINLVRAQLVRLLGEEAVPQPDNMLRSLNRIARETRRLR
jgi:hypothetical protein